jgi:hypothetical protein
MIVRRWEDGTYQAILLMLQCGGGTGRRGRWMNEYSGLMTCLLSGGVSEGVSQLFIDFKAEMKVISMTESGER